MVPPHPSSSTSKEHTEKDVSHHRKSQFRLAYWILRKLKRLTMPIVLLFSLGLIVFATGQAVSFKKLGYNLGPYPYFILLVVSASFVPIFFSLVLYINIFAGGFLPESTTFKFKVHFFVIGLMNAINGVLFIFAIPHTSGTLQQILSQTVLPFTMILSLIFLKVRYTKIQYLGCFIVLGGVAISLVPTLSGKSGEGFHSGNGSSAFWAVMFLLGEIPIATASVYQEYQFSKAKLNIIYMMAWSNLGQFAFLLLFAPLNFIPHFGGLSPSSFIDNMRDAGLCLANELPGHPECKGGSVIIVFCILTMLMTNVCQAGLVKYGSATLCVIVQTIVTPVSTLAFTFHFLMGAHTETMTPYDWAALGVLLVGVIIYRVIDLKVMQMRELKADHLDAEERVGLLHSSSPDGTSSLVDDADLQAVVDAAEDEDRPLLISSRMGIINCEYTDSKHDPRNILLQYTRRQPGPETGSVQDSLFAPLSTSAPT